MHELVHVLSRRVVIHAVEGDLAGRLHSELDPRGDLVDPGPVSRLRTRGMRVSGVEHCCARRMRRRSSTSVHLQVDLDTRAVRDSGAAVRFVGQEQLEDAELVLLHPVLVRVPSVEVADKRGGARSGRPLTVRDAVLVAREAHALVAYARAASARVVGEAADVALEAPQVRLTLRAGCIPRENFSSDPSLASMPARSALYRSHLHREQTQHAAVSAAGRRTRHSHAAASRWQRAPVRQVAAVLPQVGVVLQDAHAVARHLRAVTVSVPAAASRAGVAGAHRRVGEVGRHLAGGHRRLARALARRDGGGGLRPLRRYARASAAARVGERRA